jgi:Na+/phosphate symporter
LSRSEFENLKFHFGTSRWGGTRKLPMAFSEHGVAMLSAVLRSKRAVLMSILIIKAFVRMREVLTRNKELAEKLELLESKVDRHDKQIASIVEAIRRLMIPPESSKRRIGF